MDLSGKAGLPCLHLLPPAHESNKEHPHKAINNAFIFMTVFISSVCLLFNHPAANICCVLARGLSPAGVKTEPDQDGGFCSSPQHYKASKRDGDEKESVSDSLN